MLRPKPTAFAHILLLRVRSTYIRLGTLGFLWMAPKGSAVREGWVRLGIPPPVPHASLYSCSAACLSGSTLDASAAGRWFDSRCPSRPSGGSGKGKQRVGRQPAVGRGRWWGALLQVAGFLFALRICGHTPVFCSCPSGSGEKNQKREGSQSPVGRGRWEEALLQAGLKPVIYATTANDVNHYTTLPPLHVAQVHGVPTGLFPRSLTYALWTSPHCVPLSLALSALRSGVRDVRCVSTPLGVRTRLCGLEELWLPAML